MNTLLVGALKTIGLSGKIKIAGDQIARYFYLFSLI